MILIQRKYIPTDPSVIRSIAIAKGLKELGVNVRLLFLVHDQGTVLPDMGEIQVQNLSEGIKTNNKILQLLYSLYKIQKIREEKEPIILTSFLATVFIYLSFLKGPIYHERTETGKNNFKGRFADICERYYIHRIKHTAGVFVISNTLRENLTQKGVNPQMIHNVSILVDTSRFDHLTKNPEKRYIAYCGTITNKKDGVNDLLRAMGIVHKKYPDVYLYILGLTPHKWDVEENQRIIEELGISEVVFQPGLVPFDKMPKMLLNAEILALARPDNETSRFGFPTKLGEYLMTGNPVVVTRVGELDHYLQDKESCLFAIPGNYEDFANKLIWCLEHPEEGATIGRQGKAVAEKEFNYLHQASLFLNAIKK